MTINPLSPLSLEGLEEKALATISQYNMLHSGESVAVGFSGGADSVALLLLLHELREKYNLTLTALHLNHTLRGAESDADEAFARALAQQLDIPFVAKSLPIAELAKKEGLSIEECARTQRYRFFQQAEADKIATAHTLSDSVETTLFHLTRGTGLEGLTGIPPVREEIIRPLIHCTRKDVLQYLAMHSQNYQTDSTNLQADYTRNYIRLHIVPRLQQINPALELAVGRLQELLQQDSQYLEEETQKALLTITQNGSYSRKDFLALAPAIAGRALRLLLTQQQAEYDNARIQLLLQTISTGKGVVQLSETLFFQVEQESFFFTKPETDKLQPPFRIEYTLPAKDWEQLDIPLFPGKTIRLSRLSREDYKHFVKNQPNLLKNILNYDKIRPLLTFRSRQSGDAFAPYRRKRKTLKKYFSEENLSQAHRSQAVIVEMDGEIIWVETLGATADFAVLDTTNQILLLEFITTVQEECNKHEK